MQTAQLVAFRAASSLGGQRLLTRVAPLFTTCHTTTHGSPGCPRLASAHTQAAPSPAAIPADGRASLSTAALSPGAAPAIPAAGTEALPWREAADASNADACGVQVRSKPGDHFFASDPRPVVLFDGVCNFCNAGVNFVLDHDKTGKLRLAALQSDAGKALLQRSGRAPDDISSIVLVEKDQSYIKSEAALRIGQLLDIPLAALAPLVLLVTPRVIGDTLYDVVANNRYNLMGMRDNCRLGDNKFSERFLEK